MTDHAEVRRDAERPCWCGRKNARSRETGYCTARHADLWRAWTPERRAEATK